MKKYFMGIILFGLTISQPVMASNDSVKWIGTLIERRGYHTPEHSERHVLELRRQDNSETYKVIKSEALVATHIEKDKKLLVEIEGELTPRFLFWGGNLIVKSFIVLNELDEIPHHESVNQQSTLREYRSLRGRL